MTRRVLLVVEHRRNEELLRDWLLQQDDFVPFDGAAGAPDLVIADGAALTRRRTELEQLRERDRPAYLPLLLVASAPQVRALPRDVWQLADEILTTPVRRSELTLRLARLVALREQSVATARRLDELGRSNVDLEQFAYVAAHELAAPLAVVTGALETIAGRYRDRFDDSVKPLIDAAEHESERLQTLIHDLLTFARAGRRVTAVDVQLRSVVRESIKALRPQIQAVGAEIQVADLPKVRVDPRQLRIVFTNLIGNALKYRDPARPPRVDITCEDDGAYWRVCVRDNGLGVPRERIDSIFEMFERADGRQVGHGIGLALCRRIIERHDGRIWAEPADGHGTVFCLTLPKR